MSSASFPGPREGGPGNKAMSSFDNCDIEVCHPLLVSIGYLPWWLYGLVGKLVEGIAQDNSPKPIMPKGIIDIWLIPW